ncbi:MAG: hypothetical protein JSS10_08045 [Verrucomicrobia bacterium]|nr:hypothetical protein [Verrucomicrobiota bacterium]
MATTRPVLLRPNFDQAWQQEQARINELFRMPKFFLKAAMITAVVTTCCGLGIQATEQTGKKRTLANKAFLAAGVIGAVATLSSLVAAVYFTLKSNKA